MAGDRKPAVVLQTEFSESNGQLSPDGRWLAYTSNVSGRPEVYVRPLPSAAGQVKISTQGGMQPRWRGDGREVFYIEGRKLMAATVNSRAGFEARVPQALFEARMPPTGPGGYQYDVTADGKRFLVITSRQEMSEAPITVEVNWLAGAKR